MSRIGKLPIKLPKGVEIKISCANTISVIGPHGTLRQPIPIDISIIEEDRKLIFESKRITRSNKAMHGLARTLVNNMVIGVTNKFTKKLQLQGVGYRAQIIKSTLSLSLGYSHEINLQIPPKIDVNVDNNTSITITGIEKEMVGLFASKIRNLRPPEPYNGKGVLYDGEILIRKAGKVGK